MATLWIHEFAGISNVFGPTPVVPIGFIAKQKLAFGTPSAVLNVRTKIVRLFVDASATVFALENATVAAVDDIPMASESTEYFDISVSNLKIVALARP